MSYCYINLEKTNYKPSADYKILSPNDVDIKRLLEIYDLYAKHHEWDSVWPIYPEEFFASHNETIGYFHNNKIVAWSIMYKINNTVIEAEQFAWDYVNPELQLGYESMKTECAIYKQKGYEIIILGDYHEYKKKIDGFELFGKENRGSKKML